MYIGGPKNPARKCLKMIKNVSKVAEYKINVENSVTFLNINKNTPRNKSQKHCHLQYSETNNQKKKK